MYTFDSMTVQCDSHTTLRLPEGKGRTLRKRVHRGISAHTDTTNFKAIQAMSRVGAFALGVRTQ